MENNSIFTTKDLVEIIGGNNNGKKEVDFKKLKYILYVRKSTDEKDKQLKSLQDQIDECKEYAQQRGLRIVEIIQESESAKYSGDGIRPKFRKMLEDVQSGKYDAIMAWHPNRLARNMKDAGEIIDLLDRDIIVDLKFASFYFENTASGKLTLGITFALAKQYTDQLSDDITRGNARRTMEGVSIAAYVKHGYMRDKNRKLIPNGKNFHLIKDAFYKKLNHETNESICTYLNESGYERYVMIDKETKKYGNVLYKFNKDTIGQVFKNSIYTGVLKYGDIVVDLIDIYNFVPMITVDEYCKINKIKDGKILLIPGQRKEIKAKLLNGKVKCICGENMKAALTSKIMKNGEKIHYFNYRCDNKGSCKNYGKSIRAKEIIKYIREYISNCNFDYDKAYKFYKNEIEEKIKKESLILLNNEKSLNKKRSILIEKEKNTKTTLNSLDIHKDDLSIINSYKTDLSEILKEIKEIDKNLKEIVNKKEENKNVIFTLPKMVELLKNLANSIREDVEIPKLEKALQNTVLNLIIDDKKVLKLELEKPLDEALELKKDPKVLIGGRTKS